MKVERDIEPSAPGVDEQVMSHHYCYPRAVEIWRCGSPAVRFPSDTAAVRAAAQTKTQVAGPSSQLARAVL